MDPRHQAPTTKKEISKYVSNINNVLRLATGADLVVSGVYPNACELAEAAGMHIAYMDWILPELRKYHSDIPRNIYRNVHVYAIADGVSPRAGLMFALKSKYRVFSIDPLMYEKYVIGNSWGHLSRGHFFGQYCRWEGIEVWDTHISCKIENLRCLEAKIEEFDQEKECYEHGLPEVAILVLCHAHTKLSTCLKHIKAKKEYWVIAMPCCMNILDEEHQQYIVHSYRDEGIPSPKNEISILRIPCRE